MTAIGTYGTINAKVRAMRSFLLSPAKYRNLIEIKDMRGLLSGLSETPYGDVLKTVDIQDTEQFEAALLRQEISRFRAIEKHTRKEPNRFIQLLLERYDCERFKILLRYWHKRNLAIPDILYDYVVYPIDAEHFKTAVQPADLIPLLEGTPYQSVLSKTVSEYTNRKSLFPVELALDKRMFQVILDHIQSFRKKDRVIAKKLLGLEIDIKNMEWFYRYRHYYDLASAEVLNLLLPYGYRFTADMIRRLAEGDNLLKVISDAIPGIEFPEHGDGTDIQFMEGLMQMLYHLLYHEAGRAFSDFPFSIGSMLGYFYHLRFETRNIRTLAYAKYYNLSAEQTEMQLIFQG